MANNIKVNLKGLDKLAKVLGDQFSIKVGIMGGNAQKKHDKSKLTNAEIGFINEFGSYTKKIPPRSFLEMPLRLYLADYLLKKKAFSQQAIDEAVKNGTLFDLARKVGIVGEEVVQQAFASRGFGQWKPNAPSTIKGKGSDSPLIDTGELRRSITSRVEKK